MKIVLFEDILETHVRKSLSDALIARGHDVIMARALWKGHRFPENALDLDAINDGLSEAMAHDPDPPAPTGAAPVARYLGRQSHHEK